MANNKCKNSIEKTSSGKFVFRYNIKDSDGKWHSKKSKVYDTQAACMRAKMQYDLEKSDLKNNKHSLETIASQYIESHYSNKAILTKNAANNIYKNYIAKFFDVKVNLDSLINSQSIFNFKKFLNDYKCNYKHKNNCISLFIAICNYAYLLNAIGEEKLKYVKLHLTKYSRDRAIIENKEHDNFYTFEEYTKFQSVIENSYYKMLFDTLFYGGFRIGELLALTPEDFENNQVRVNKQRLQSGEIVPPKSRNSNRTIPLKQSVYNTVLAYISDHQIQKNVPIFAITRISVEYQKNKYVEKANIHPITIHGFRHSCCTYLFNLYTKNNLPINFKFIANYLGHEVQETLNIYSHLTKDDKNQIVELINKE